MKLLINCLLILFLVSCQTKYETGFSTVSIEPSDKTVSLTLAGYAAPYLGRFTITWDDVGLISEHEGLFPMESENLQDFGENIISLTRDDRNLYALSSEGWLLQRPLNRKDAEWMRIGYNNGKTYTIDIKRIAFANGKLYAFASDGRLYRSRHSTNGDLSVRAMAIRKGKTVAVIVGVDVCGFDDSFTKSIKQEISRKKIIPPEAIMINASHTHFAPVTQKWLTWGKPNQLPDSLYLNLTVRAGIIQAIEEALNRMEPSYLYFGRDTTDIGFNRNLKNELALYDRDVDVIKVISTDGKIKSVLFTAGCHPVFTDQTSGHFTMSANFPGYARTIIEKETGATNSIFLQGCAGDINPKNRDPFTVSGIKLAKDVLRTLEQKMEPIEGRISVSFDSIAIPVSPWTKEEIIAFRETNMGKHQDAWAEKNINWANLMLTYLEHDAMPKTMPVYIQTFQIGNWKLVGLSREATTEFGMKIKEMYSTQNVSVTAYNNDVPSYLSTDPHIEAKTYEGYDSFFWYGQPSPFPLKTMDVVIYQIKKVR